MKVKYTGLNEEIVLSINLNGKPQQRSFVRNRWSEIPNEVAEIVLKSDYFISESSVNFDKNIPSGTTILLKRGYALGDLIQLIPVVRYLKRKYNFVIHIWTSSQYVSFLKMFNVFDEVYGNKPKMKYDHFYILDGVLESDHSLKNEERSMHRVKIFENFFNVEVDFYDFHL